MGTNETMKKPMTVQEKNRRAELRKERERRRKKKAIQKAMIYAVMACFAIALIALLGYTGWSLFKGDSSNDDSDKIVATGSTFTIMIDPGHGGEDKGIGSDSLLEKDVTLDIAAKLKIMLESQGYTVLMTRSDDTYVSKEDRVAAANASGADLLVSIHGNYSDDTVLTGISSFYNQKDAHSKLLAEKIQTAVILETSAEDADIHKGSFAITSDTTMPSVLVEVGYFSNAEEAGLMADDSYQNLTAKGIAKGIIKSLVNE